MKGSATQRRLGSFLLWGGLLAFVVAFGMAPLALMIVQAVGRHDSATSFFDRRTGSLLARTLALALSAALLATLLGTAAGYRLGVTTWKGKALARVILILPLVISPYLHAIGWTTLLRAGGPFSSWLSATFGVARDFTSNIIYSFAGATVVLALAYFPIALFFTEKSLSLSSPSLVEAAQVFGANRWQAFRTAHWPFIRPAFASSGMIIFLLAASDLGVPTILKVRVFNFEVFTRLSAFNDVTAATLLTLPLLLVGLLAVGVERRVTAADGIQHDVREVQPPRAASRRQVVINIILFGSVAAVALGLPFGAIVAEGANREAVQRMIRLAVQPGLNTLRYAITAAAVMTFAFFVLALTTNTAPRWQRRTTDGLLVLGFAVPSTILALALLALYDRPVIARWITPSALVVAALVVRYGIVGYRILGTAIAQIPDELVEAAASLGAGRVRIAVHVILPMTRVALITTFAISFILAVGEIGSTILLYPPGGETLPIALYSIEANSPRSYVAAMTILLLALCVIPLILVALLVRTISHGSERE